MGNKLAFFFIFFFIFLQFVFTVEPLLYASFDRVYELMHVGCRRSIARKVDCAGVCGRNPCQPPGVSRAAPVNEKEDGLGLKENCTDLSFHNASVRC